MECACVCHGITGVSSNVNACCACAGKAEAYLTMAVELAEYLGQVAALLPSNCDGDEECGSDECPACRAFVLCRKFREIEGSLTK